MVVAARPSDARPRHASPGRGPTRGRVSPKPPRDCRGRFVVSGVTGTSLALRPARGGTTHRRTRLSPTLAPKKAEADDEVRNYVHANRTSSGR